MEMKHETRKNGFKNGFGKNWKWEKMRKILGHVGLLLAVAAYTALGALSPHKFSSYYSEDVKIVNVESFFSDIQSILTDWVLALVSFIMAEILELSFKAFSGKIFRELEHPAEVSRLNGLIRDLEEQRIIFKTSFTCKEDMLKCHQVFHNYEKAVTEACKGGVELPLNSKNKLTSRWSFPQSAFFASTVLTTIGYGNIVPSTFWGRLFCILFALIGIPLTVSVIADIGILLASALSALHSKVKTWFPNKVILPNLTSSKTRWLSAIAGVLFLILYLAAGAAVFMLWEKDWGFFEGFYFCFITLTTIGFGDLVLENPNHMLMCTLYILMGLALTSAIIELVRRQYAQSWKTIQALSGPLAESLRRFGECAGTGIDVALLQNDLKKMLTLVNTRKTENAKEWQDTVDSVLKDILQDPGQKTPKILQIVIYESSV